MPIFKSKLEINQWKALRKLLKGKADVQYEGESLQYNLPKSYVPDFIVSFPDGRKLYLETKGYFRYEDQVKLRAVKANNPDHDIRLVFAANNKISKKHKMRYSDWADKYGFPYCIGRIPKEWFQ